MDTHAHNKGWPRSESVVLLITEERRDGHHARRVTLLTTRDGQRVLLEKPVPCLPVVFGELSDHAKGVAARHNGGLVDGLCPLPPPPQHQVSFVSKKEKEREKKTSGAAIFSFAGVFFLPFV